MEILNHIGLEAAVGKTSLAKKLISVIEKLRLNNTYTHEEIKKNDVTGMILDETGMNVTVMVKKGVGLNAYVIFPSMDRNHPFYTTYGMYGSSESSQVAINMSDTELKGWVDPKDFKVGGVYSKVKVDMVIGYELMRDTRFTVAEIASIMLHELGHIYTYFEMFGLLTRKNFMIADVVKTLQGGSTIDKKELKLIEAERTLGIKIDRKNDLINIPNDKKEDLISSVLITQDYIQAGTSSSTGIYDIRTIEQIADKFVISNGGGVELASALNKLYETYWVKETRSPALYVAIEIAKFILWMISLSIFPLTTIFYTVGILPGPKIYDSPEARIKIIKQQLIGSLKDLKSEPVMRKEIQDQIQVVEDIEKTLKDRRSLLEIIYQNVTPRGRIMYKQEVFMKNIESLLYNNTYLNAAKFGAIKDE